MISIKNKSLLLIFIMVSVALGVGGVFSFTLYKASVEEQKKRLIEVAKSRARMIEAVAKFDIRQNSIYPEGSKAATISQIKEAHKNFGGFGKTGEYTLAERIGNEIRFILHQRHQESSTPQPVSIDSVNAEPMRRALQGNSGVMIGLDYRGVKVLAAYEPVDVLNFGIVTKIDIAEIRMPFYQAGGIASLSTIFLIILGGLGLRKASAPLISDLIRANDALKESEERLRLALEATSEGIWDWNIETNEVFFSPQWCKSLGYSPNEIKPNLNSWKKLVHPDDITKVIKKLDVHLKGRTQYFEMEHRLKTKSGDWRWYLDRGKVVERDDSGKPLRMIGTDTDITFRKKFEATLLENKNRFHSIFSTAVDSIIVIDDTGLIELFNPAAEKLFGWSLAETLGKNIKMLMPEPDRSSHDYYIRSYLKTGKAKIIGLDREIKAIRRDGSVFSAKLAVSEAWWDNRRVFIGSLMDITERKMAENLIIYANKRLVKQVQERTEALREEKTITEALGVVVEGANEALIVDQAILICLDQVCALINWSFGHAFKVDPSDNTKLIPTGLFHFDGDRHSANFESFLKLEPLDIEECIPGRVLGQRKLNFTEDLSILANESRRKMAMELEFKMALAFPITVKDKVVGVLEFFTQTQNVPSIKTFAALEKMGVVLGRPLERARIDEMKTEFVSTAAHELRTPTTIIRGYAELLSHRPGLSPEKLRKFSSKISEEAKNLSCIVEDLLDVACIDAGHAFEVSKIPEDIGELFREELNQLSLINSRHKFDFSISGNPLKVLIDKSKIRQLVRNILSNAIKYSPQGGAINAKIYYSQEQVVCSISDEGIGMHLDEVERVFEKFYRVDKSGSIKGTGLGLTLVKHIVEAHKGEVWLNSEFGKGTTVIFSLPV